MLLSVAAEPFVQASAIYTFFPLTQATLAHIMTAPLDWRIQLAKSVLDDRLDIREYHFRAGPRVILRVQRSSLPGPSTFIRRFFRDME